MARLEAAPWITIDTRSLNALTWNPQDAASVTGFDGFDAAYYQTFYNEGYETLLEIRGYFSLNEETGVTPEDTLTELAQFYFGPESNDWILEYYLSGVEVPLSVYVNISQSESTADDAWLIRSILSGNDEFILGDYGDYVDGHSGDDTFAGNGGADTLNGGLGNDTIKGGTGNDLISGGSGLDSLEGGLGKDYLNGGAGSDRFVFRTSAESGTSAASADIINDFRRGQDKINLSAIDAFSGTTKNDAFIWKGTAAFNNAKAGEVRYQKYDNSGTSNDYTMVWVDTDKDTGVEMAIRLTGLHNLSASDFIL